MKRLFLAAAGAGAAAALAAGCGSSGTTSSATPPAPSASSPSAASPGAASPGASAGGPTTVRTADSPLGTILVDGSGRTLYLYTPDGAGKPTCTGQCASIWPPDTTTGTPQAGGGLAASMLGTAKRPDNTVQVTFAGHPLYRFSHDSKPGDVKGEGVQGIWFAVSPSGSPVTSGGASSPASSAGTSTGSGGGGGYGY